MPTAINAAHLRSKADFRNSPYVREFAYPIGLHPGCESEISTGLIELGAAAITIRPRRDEMPEVSGHFRRP